MAGCHPMSGPRATLRLDTPSPIILRPAGRPEDTAMPATADAIILPVPDPLTDREITDAREFHAGPCAVSFGATGRAMPELRAEVWRRNGATQTWKRDPGRFRVPVKYGLYGYGAITDRAEAHPADRCPASELALAWWADADHAPTDPAERGRARCNHPEGHRPAQLAR